MKQDTATAQIASVKSYSYPYDYWHDRYQDYYREGLREYLDQRGGNLETAPVRFSRTLRLLRRVRYSSRLSGVLGPVSHPVNSLVDGLAACMGARSQLRHPPPPAVGQYTFRFMSGREITACIDSSDLGDDLDPSLLAENDVYFKTNYWIGRDYDHKTVPMYNCNPLVLRHLGLLREMRLRPARYDLCLVVRVWGGRDEVEGVEHCVRLLEAVARAPGRKFLLAYLVAGDTKALAARLSKIGIPSTTTPVPLKDLWSIAAQSRINIIRLGMHHCVPWRMTDLLALGACPVLDQPPKTVWPVPLREGSHYSALNLVTSPDQPMADDDSYRCVPDLLDSLLRDSERVERLRGATADYFDHHLQPERVGRSICEAVTRRVRAITV
jgi:hypothetical protein